MLLVRDDDGRLMHPVVETKWLAFKTHALTLDCVTYSCVVHSPSEHNMADWPLNWRGDRMLMERICTHGVGHPDPDSAARNVRLGKSIENQHTCDGCCAAPSKVE